MNNIKIQKPLRMEILWEIEKALEIKIIIRHALLVVVV
jgi:hypothetical protein